MAAELDLSASSLPGLTRQSIFLRGLASFPMDARVKPAHDESELDAPGIKPPTAPAQARDPSAARGP
jgi:hypothetical protein